MPAYVFDIEGDGLGELTIDKKGRLHKEVTRVHCLVLRDFDTDEVKVYRQNADEDSIAEGVAELYRADVAIGHNILQYDLPVLRRFYGEQPVKAFDTLVAARLLWPDAKNHPHGGNSVEKLAVALGMRKVGLDIEDWSQWTPEMEARCVQDTAVQAAIFRWLKPKVARFRTALRVEMRVAEIVGRQTSNGVDIAVDEAEELADQLTLAQAEALDELHRAFPPIRQPMKTPAYYTAPDGVQYQRKKDAPHRLRPELQAGPPQEKVIPFNPDSSQQIADRLRQKYKWVAPLTKAGNPSCTETVLQGLEYPEAQHLLHYQMAGKRLQHLRDWITRARHSRTPGRIHPMVNTCGAASFRATHQQPNQTACPKVTDADARGFAGRYGWEMRSLWRSRPGWLMVGGDASGLQLRMLAHSLARWDGGEYTNHILHGNIHEVNMQAGGLDTYDQSKTTFYAYLFGALNPKVGTTIADHGSLSLEQRAKYQGRDREKIGAEFRRKFEGNLKGFSQLQAVLDDYVQNRGYIPLLDGRHAPVRKQHAALNTLLQGNEAVVMKLAMCLLHHELSDIMWDQCAQMLWPHDELQFEAHPDVAERVAQTIPWAIAEAGRRLRCRCPLDGEAKIGHNWAETH